MSSKSPCQNCKNREFKCHSKCDKYKNFVERNEQRKHKIYLEKMVNSYAIDCIMSKKNRRKINKFRKVRG